MSALLFLLLAPLFTGSLKWLKARLQNRRGPDPLYDYKNFLKLWRKTWIRPQGSSPLFMVAPAVSLLGVALAAAFLPMLPGISFAGDFLVLVYLLNLGRFFQVLAALDTGSAFGGQGSYRENLVAVLAEPGSVLALGAVGLASGGLSLATFSPLSQENALVYTLALVALSLALLAEGTRLPVDDPTTHLELTMIHEAQLLDHSGPLLALYELSSGLKLLVYVGLIALLIPLGALSFPTVLLLAWLALGYLETYGVKLRYLRLPDLMSYSTLSGILAVLGVVLRFRI
ncbi:respiratory chain complex I subunit 1 family protein [Calidithermus timidus]|jgi:formate hydrogenlyase subunit 4|uniref:respiratory chain complex I subunit 1 family protein n=1 Tax=Calidithermus timidus TaxID=307124 RepID=UPI00036557EB|nr:NADH-quinone oxidoreductase subunit H [Calidithermus timidus]